MFTLHSTDVVGFSSKPQDKRDARHSGTQTQERQMADQYSQSSSVKNTTTQTEAAPSTTGYDEDALATFLARIAPLVCEELDMEADFSVLDKDSAEEESTLVRLKTYPANSAEKQKKVSTMSWNSTGCTLAVGFAVVRHDTWCGHDSKVVLYNTTQHRATPPRIYMTASCVTTVCFHPSEPSLLMAGLYNGEVLVWDLRKEEDWAVVESATEHSTCVVQVGWYTYSSIADCYSAGADGCILLKKIGSTNRKITTVERLLVNRGHMNSKLPNRDEHLEIMAMAPLVEDNYVVGVGGGGLFHCILSSLQPPSRRPGFKDPVSFAYQSHQTVITAIKQGPGGKTFASASSDGQIRVYKSLEVEPKCVVNTKGCPLDIFWTDSPAVFGICDSDNAILFIKATTGQVLQMTLELTSTQPATVSETAANRGVVAIGDVAGNVEIWRIAITKQIG